MDSGAITQAQYFQAIGNPSTNPAPNIKFIWFNTNLLNQTNNINKQIQAVKAANFAVSAVWHMDQPTGMVADIVLPRAEVFEEDPTIVSWGVSGFQLTPKLVQPTGDIKSIFWIHVQIAKALGVIQQYAPQLANVGDADWDETMISALQNSYNTWATANKVTTTLETVPREPCLQSSNNYSADGTILGSGTTRKAVRDGFWKNRVQLRVILRKATHF